MNNYRINELLLKKENMKLIMESNGINLSNDLKMLSLTILKNYLLEIDKNIINFNQYKKDGLINVNDNYDELKLKKEKELINSILNKNFNDLTKEENELFMHLVKIEHNMIDTDIAREKNIRENFPDLYENTSKLIK